MQSTTKTVSFSARLFWILMGAVMFIVAAHFLLQYLNLVVYHQQNGAIYELSNRLDLDDESSLGTWLSQFLLLLVAVAAGLAAYLHKDTFKRRLFGIVAGAGLLFSIDEVASLHEFVLQLLHVTFFQDAPPTGLNNAWWLVAPFIVIAGGFFLYKMMVTLPMRLTVLFAVAALAFLSGAIFVDMLTSVSDRETFIHQGILVGIEEMMELVGTVIALYALVDYLERLYPKQLKETLERLRIK